MPPSTNLPGLCNCDAKEKEVEELETQISSVKASLGSKERALAKAQTNNDELRARVTKVEGDLHSMRP